jgi:Flp pilus assembly protein TadG
MNGCKSQRGQIFVLTALSLTMVLGFSGLVIDVGSWYRAKRQLQASADAAALAGAQALPDRTKATQLAVDYADGNGGGLDPNDITFDPTFSTNDTIAVKVSKQEPGFFSRIFNTSPASVGATAKARIGSPSQARYVAPMVVSEQHRLIRGTAGCPCFGVETKLDFDPMGAPGAFGMLNLDGGSGTPGTSDEAFWIKHGFDKYLPLGDYRSDPGAKFSSGNLQSALQDRIGTVLLFPVFRTLVDQGQNADYLIIGWIGFWLDDYVVHGNNATLTGHFTEFLASGILSSTGTGSPPAFGVRSIRLIG